MPRTVVTGTDPTTNQTHVYEGVALEQLMAVTTLSSGGETVEIEVGSHKTQTIYRNDLESGTRLIVVDTVDGKPIPRYAPYDLVTEVSGKPTLTIINVRCIRIRAS